MHFRIIFVTFFQPFWAWFLFGKISISKNFFVQFLSILYPLFEHLNSWNELKWGQNVIISIKFLYWSRPFSQIKMDQISLRNANQEKKVIKSFAPLEIRAIYLLFAKRKRKLQFLSCLTFLNSFKRCRFCCPISFGYQPKIFIDTHGRKN